MNIENEILKIETFIDKTPLNPNAIKLREIRTGIYKDGKEIPYQEMVTGMLNALAKQYSNQNKLSIDEAQQQVEAAYKKAKQNDSNLFKSGKNLSGIQTVAQYLLGEKK